MKLKPRCLQRCSAPAAPPGVGVNQADGTDSAVILRDLLFFLLAGCLLMNLGVCG